MSDMVSVPAEKIAALREALIPGKWPAWEWDMKMRDAARAVVDAAETEDEDWPFTKERPRHLWEGNFTPAPSPARDDAEARRALWREAAEKGIRQGLDWPRIVLTLFGDIDRLRAHMAAPDELTALRAEHERDVRNLTNWAMTREAERDALRKRIRTLADETPYKTTDYLDNVTGYLISADELDAALGDA